MKNLFIIFLLFSFSSFAQKKEENSKKKESYKSIIDTDAITDSLKMVELFLNEGRNVYMIDLKDGEDPSSLGFKKFTELMENTQTINQAGLLKYKLQSI